ncbi:MULTISPECIES: YhgE/Pip family protein [unclassified Paenibacillus]|uniref:YhgE/Pip family protein n=1 Tax=unclassified Paenibacillus TaxID=185978 RepID=UPI000CFC0C57|nr:MULTISPECIES: YhgE/Pip domain-containing protein [unclassified Paenibacillus]PRA09673.1 hypothetical protein CQ043_00100 [Paenibacillus sp. MYb63]PRA42312.1 hypothetical protein CQ061_29460 [Paenibacillus sp. MYb67]
MKSLSVFFKDVGSAVRNPKVLIPVIAIMFIPILYSGIYLAAYWDPYGHVDEMPVAVVNLDKGAELEGKSLHVGSDLVDELKKNADFKWDFVSASQAKEGMSNDKYYMQITIPENFSSQATTLLDDKPEPADLIYEPNGNYSFVGAQIGKTAIKDLKAKVSAKVTESYAETLLDKFSEVSDGLAEAGDGAGELNTGAGKLDDGAVKLKDNLAKLASGTLELQEGLSPLSDGVNALHTGATKLESGTSNLVSGLQQLQAAASSQLQSGADQLKDGSAKLETGLQSSLDGTSKLQAGLKSSEQGSAKLSDGLQSAVQGSGTLATGLQSAVDGSSKVADGAQGVAVGLKQLAASNPELAENADVQKLLAASEAVADGSAQLHESEQKLAQGADQLHQGNQQLAAGATELHGGQEQLLAGANQLVDGQQQLLAGAGQLSQGGAKLSDGLKQFSGKLGDAASGGTLLADGAKQLGSGTTALQTGVGKLSGGVNSLTDGSKQLGDGAGKLADGLTELKDGSGELATKLNDAAQKTSEVKKTDDVVNMFAEPVNSSENTAENVSNYGTGLTPFFLSIGLFVGSLISTIVLKMRETSVPGATGWNRFVSRTLVFGSVSIFQSVIVASFMLYGLGLETHSVGLFYLFTIITGLTFMLIVQALVTWLDLPGRYVVILLLVFQLAASAGTFPVELIPSWLQAFSPWLPMTHSIMGFKAVVSSGNLDVMWHQAGILSIYAGVSILLTLAYFLWNGRRPKKEVEQADSGQVVTA